jgi:hypothetical protein
MTSNLAAGFADGSRLMARLSTQFTAPALEWRVDPGHRPTIAERRDSRPVGALILAIALVWLAVAARDLAAGGARIAGLGIAGGYLSLAIGVALALWGCRVLMRRQRIRIDRDGVHVRLEQLFWITSWSAPLAQYRGVVWRSVPIRRRGARRTVHLIDLWHPDPDRTVTLLSSTDGRAAEDFWRAWAAELGLAPIRSRSSDAGSMPAPADTRLATTEPTAR